MVLAMVEDDAAKSVINAVVDVIAAFPIAHGFSDDSCHRRSRGGHEKPPRLGQDFDIFREQSSNFDIYLLGQRAERFDMLIVWRGKSAADVEDLDFMAARFGLAKN